MAKQGKIIASDGLRGIIRIEHEYGEDYVYWIWGYENNPKLHRSVVKYNVNGDAYFMAYGRRQYLSNYMRV